LGYRVHGVLPALANGVPGILVKYDSRSTELANTHAIPSVELSDLKSLSVDAVLDSVDFSEFNRLFDARYDKMRFVLEQNGLPHRL
jgi:polysaccharide pyruvyl transferase WcaK-like protein